MNWTPIKAVASAVLVDPETVDHDETELTFQGRSLGIHASPIDPKTGLATSREIELHTGRIVSIGQEARRQHPELQVGQLIAWQRDKYNEVIYDGETINRLETMTECKCGRRIRADTIIGIIQDVRPKDATPENIARLERLRDGYTLCAVEAQEAIDALTADVITESDRNMLDAFGIVGPQQPSDETYDTK